MRTVVASAIVVSMLRVATPVAGLRQVEPGPEHKKFETLVGVWRLEGTLKAVPQVGAADSGPVSYTHINRMINGGFFLETRRTGTGPRGEVNELFLFSYNPASKTYRQDGYGQRGMLRAFTFTIDGQTWTFRGTNTPFAGSPTQERYTIVYSADMTTGTVRSEHSQNGVDWFERLTGKYTRVSATVPR